MKYLIIGLGIYGANLARDLTAQGNEVIGADRDADVVDAIKDDISTAYRVDSTEPSALDILPLGNVDLVIVAIGENFGASVKTVALLRQRKVQHIYARAIDPLHEAILKCFDLDRILTPEQHAAGDLALEMLLGGTVTTMPLTPDTMVAQFTIPDYYEGKKYADLRLGDFGVTLLAATRRTQSKGLLGLGETKNVTLFVTQDGGIPDDAAVERGDTVLCLASNDSLKRMMHHIS